jgi:hypothetical protein
MIGLITNWKNVEGGCGPIRCITPASNTNLSSEVLGFRTSAIVRNSKHKKTQRFGNWICDHQRLRLALSKGPNRVGASPSRLRTETNPVSEMLCFLLFGIPDDGHSPETQYLMLCSIIGIIHLLWTSRMWFFIFNQTLNVNVKTDKLSLWLIKHHTAKMNGEMEP